MMTVRVRPGRVLAYLLVAIAVLLVLHFLGVVAGIERRGNAYAYSVVNLDSENSVGTWFASFILLTVAVLAGVIGAAKRRAADRWYRHWLGLAVLALLASIDEGSRLHEQTSRILRRAPRLVDPVPGPAWVVAGLAVVVVLLLVYLRFLAHLPRTTRYLFLLGAGLLVLGAIGTEIAGVELARRRTIRSYGYQTLAGLEEALEKVGVSILIYALLDYVRKYVPPVLVTAREESPQPPSDPTSSSSAP